MALFIKSLIFSVFFFNIALSQLQDFIGSDSCESCHPDQFELWKSSTHGRAGGVPFSSNIKAPFDGKKIELKDVFQEAHRLEHVIIIFAHKKRDFRK